MTPATPPHEAAPMSSDHQTTASNALGSLLGFSTLVYQNAASLLGALVVAIAPAAVNAAAKWLAERASRKADARLRALEDRAVVAETHVAELKRKLERQRIQRADG